MQATLKTHLVLFALVAGMLATFSGRAQAQGSSPYPRDTDPSFTLATAPSASTDAAPRLLSLAELQERDATLSHRLKGYGVGLTGSVAMVGVGLAVFARNLCLFGGCSARSERLEGLGMTLMLTGTGGGLVSLTGLITAGTRRHRGRQRIDTLTLTPVASVSPQGTVGGASLQLTW